MPTGRKHGVALRLYVCISLIGLLMVLGLAHYASVATTHLHWRKSVVGSAFIMICLSGIVAASFPKRCSGRAEAQVPHNMTPSCARETKGHHSDCEEYSSHVVRLGSQTLCAACSGLVVGALAAVGVSCFYFFGEWQFLGSGFSVVCLGSVLLALGFAQFRFRGVVRLLLNALFVVGALLALIGIDSSAHDFFLDVLVLALIVFWIMTRVLISQWNHWRTCNNCASARKNGEKRS
jgi:hypothetical protein